MPEQAQESGYRYYISLWLPVAVLGTLLVFVLVIQLLLSWKTHAQLAPVNSHLTQVNRLQVVNLALQRELLESLNDNSAFTAAEQRRVRNELEAIIAMQAQLSDETPQRLASAHAVLADAGIHPRETLILALSYLNKVLDKEAAAHKRLIEEITRGTAMEFRIGAIALLVLARVFQPQELLGWLTGAGLWFANTYQIAGILWLVGLLVIATKLSVHVRWALCVVLGALLAAIYGVPIALLIR